MTRELLDKWEKKQAPKRVLRPRSGRFLLGIMAARGMILELEAVVPRTVPRG